MITPAGGSVDDGYTSLAARPVPPAALDEEAA